MKTLEEKITLVKNDMLSRFPNCSHTILIRLWNDGTDSVECRHGDDSVAKIYTSTYYNDELIYEELYVDGKAMIIDKFGNEQFMYLTDKIQNQDNADIINCCPKCGCHYIYDIGYDNWECGNTDCNHTFRKKSKTGFESLNNFDSQT